MSKKVIYKNPLYIVITTIVIALLFGKNFFKLIMVGDVMAAAILALQAVVLYQIKTKHHYVKLGIQTWALYPIIREGIMVGIAILFLLEGGTKFINPTKTFWSVAQFTAGCLIFYFSEKAIEIKEDTFVKG